MKWGVRRYQNEDGTLTAAGKARYARDAKEQNWKIRDDGTAVTSGKKGGELRQPDPNRWVKEDTERTKRVADAGSNLARELKNANDRSISRNRTNPRMDLSEMSDKEMRDKINRELLERQYNEVFNQKNVSKGRKYAGRILEGVGTTLTIASSALAIALAIKELKG